MSRLAPSGASQLALHAFTAAFLKPKQSNASHTMEETAEHLGISIDTVRKIEIRALAKLQRNPEVREMARQAGFLRENYA